MLKSEMSLQGHETANQSRGDFDHTEERFRLLVECVKDYAIFMLDTEGCVTTWNEGAARIKGYSADEIIGKHFSVFYPEKDVEEGKPERELEIAKATGRFEEEGWRLRRDGSMFWASVVLTALRDEAGILRGFGKVTRDMTERKAAEDELLETNRLLEQRSAQLELANAELESFSYSVAHDMRAPARAVDGFGRLLLANHSDSLGPDALDLVQEIIDASGRMAALIDALLALSRITRAQLSRLPLDLTAMAKQLADQIGQTDPTRKVDWVFTSTPPGEGDPALVRIALEKLLENAFKFTSRRENPRIEFGAEVRTGAVEYFVRDNGAGFSMEYADQLFRPFHRLHAAGEFEGTGIGLATARRIAERHHGRIRAESAEEQGATFYFTLGGAK